MRLCLQTSFVWSNFQPFSPRGSHLSQFHSTQALNLSRFTRFSWGKDWFDRFDLCKIIYISQLRPPLHCMCNIFPSKTPPLGYRKATAQKFSQPKIISQSKVSSQEPCLAAVVKVCQPKKYPKGKFLAKCTVCKSFPNQKNIPKASF